MSILVMCACGHSNEDHVGEFGLCLEVLDGGELCECDGFDPEDA